MSKRTSGSQKEEKAPRSKAQQATSKTKKEERAETRNRLVTRLIAALVLTFLGLFLVLTMVGLHAAVLDVLRNVLRGLLGYGYWLTPFVCFFIVWILVFQNHEPFRLRSAALGLAVIFFSALLHVILYRSDGDTTQSLLAVLYTTGKAGRSGGVIPGLLGQGLVYCISRAGAIPVLLVGLVAMIFLAFRISAASLIHQRAEKRREKLLTREEPPEPEIITQDMTMEDLRVLATPPVLPHRGERAAKTAKQSRSLFMNMDGDADEAPSRPAKSVKQPAVDDDLLFFSTGKKKVKKKPEPSPYDMFAEESEDYTQQVQNLVRQEAGLREEAPQQRLDSLFSEAVPSPAPEPEEPDEKAEEPICVPPAPEEAPVTLTDEEIALGAKAAQKTGKLSGDEAAMAAEEVAREIEAQETEAPPPYQYPPMTMLQEAMGDKEDNTEEMRTNVVRLENTLSSFHVDIQIENVVRGPTVTRYEMELKPGVKMSKITSLHEDIALALGVSGVRVAAVPGKSSTIGIEVPNRITTSVPIREVLSSKEFRSHKSALAFTVGKDIGGNYIVGDIAKMPHLLIAGTTGSGKSVCMNSIIVSLLYRATPEQVRMIMIDPKTVELSIYNGIPHLLIPVVTDPKKAAGALQWAVTEMERRYQLLADYKVRDLAGYNKLCQGNPDMTYMPQVVIIIDELADLMLVAAKDVENSIVRIAQKARAAGMHLVIATQRPSTNVITGIMKANIPSRIAFAVASAIDSRIILDESGAEKLVGKGDMLYAPLGSGKPTRVQGCFITDDEAEEVAEFVKSSSESDYSEDILQEIEQNASQTEKPEAGSDIEVPNISLDRDVLLPDAVEVILDTKQASVSMLQRRLKLGYSRAARIVDELEEVGIVGPFEGSKARRMLITREQWDTMVGINPNAKAPVEAAGAPDVPEQLDDDVPFDED